MNKDPYFEYWLNNSDKVCECCVNNNHIDCRGEGECPDYYVLTEEEWKSKGLVEPNNKMAIWSPNKWDCVNVDDFEFCKRIKDSPCATCFGPEGNYLYFESNGLVK